MRWSIALHVTGLILLCVGLCMSLPLACGWYYDDTSVAPLFLSLCVTVLAGVFLMFSFQRPKPMVINHREGMVIVSLGWAACAFFGALPFALGGFPSFTDSFFESISGFTTTGASILTDIEALPKGLLFWRSLTHWLGGMGIIVLTIAILPFLGVGGMQLYKAEVPGPVADKLQPRIKDTAMSLWKVYVFFTVAQVLLLLFGGMDLFESICHAFGTMATGGFSTRNASIAAYDSAYIDGVITFFMLVAGVNFCPSFPALSRQAPGRLARSGIPFFCDSGPPADRRRDFFHPGFKLFLLDRRPALRIVSGGLHPHHHRLRHC
jgi:trk system potassium uptake protein